MSDKFFEAVKSIQASIVSQDAMKKRTFFLSQEETKYLDIKSDHEMTVREWIVINYPDMKIVENK